MHILPFRFSRSPVVAGAVCLALATVVSGCASKNPLMEEPAPVAAKNKTESVKQQEPASSQVAQEEQSTKAPFTAESTTTETAAPAKSDDVTETPVSATASAKPSTTVSDSQTGTAAAGTAIVASTATADAADKASTGVQTVQQKRFLGFFRPYRPDIQQGNFVSREMVAQLKPGMTQDQVIFLLGTPLLNDIFHADRWDYAFRLQKGNGEITTSRVTVFFKDNLVSSFEGGGDLPTEADYLARIANKAKEKKK